MKKAKADILTKNFEKSVQFQENEENNTFSFIAYSGDFIPTGFPMILEKDGELHTVEAFRFSVDGIDMERYNSNPVVLSQHRNDRLPVGKAEITKEDGQLLAEITFDESDSFSRVIKNKVENEFLRGVSMGINFDETDFTIEDGKATFNSAEFIELSVVNIPRDPKALRTKFSASEEGVLNFKDIRKNINMELEKHEEEVQKTSEKNISDEELSELNVELENLKKDNEKAKEDFENIKSEKEKAIEQLNEKLQEIEKLTEQLEDVKGKLSEKEEELNKKNKALSVNEESFEGNLTWQEAIDKIQKEENLSYTDAYLKANKKYNYLRGDKK